MLVDDGSRTRMLALLKRYGWNATSFQVIEPEFRYWFDDDGDAAVAYLDTGGAWVVAGSPIAPLYRVGDVTRRFVADAARNHRRAAFFAVEPRFLGVAPMPRMAIGQQPWWDPRLWPERHRGHRGMKEQLRRARAKGVIVERVDSSEAAGRLRPTIEQLIASWLSTRPMPPMSFLVALEPFIAASERRYYAARAGKQIVGLLVAVPVYDRGGWFFEDILRGASAPNGTAELMIDAAMRDVAESGCTFVTLGLAPLAGDVRWLRTARSAMRGFYNFEGLHAFKSKLRPDGWTPIFLAWPRGRLPIAATYDTLNAFAGGRLMRFGLRAVLRAPSPVLLMLAILLLPWTALLATAETERWFASRREQRGWVVFDLAMAAALFALSRSWRRPLAAVACAAATADGVITTTLAMRRRRRTSRDPLITAAAIAAPFTAAAILLGGLKTRKAPASRAGASQNKRR